MMRTIRPWEIFSKLKFNTEARLIIPNVKGSESETVMSLETLLLITVARIVDAKTILEIGTSMGYTSLHLAMNTHTSIVTVDRDIKPCVFQGTIWAKKIARAQKDIFDVTSLGDFDMAFCDINYTAETVIKATEIASNAQPKVIAWHDYGHVELPHVKIFLDQYADGCDRMIHVEDSSLCFWFRDGFQ